jgi:uncharacterized membrane protein YqgA involved in biofilm formation
MSFQEKVTWVSGVVTVIVALWYASVVGGPIGEVPVEEIVYRRPLLIAVGAMIGFTILGTIATAIATAVGGAIGGAIRAEMRGEGPVDVVVDDIDRSDERDASIEARGDRVAFIVSSVLMIGALALAMLERPHFWIANAIFAAFVLAGLAGTVVKLVTYRRGF